MFPFCHLVAGGPYPGVRSLVYWPDPTLHLPVRNGLAALIFVPAAITDWLDGYLARKWGQTSSFGAHLTRWPTS